MKYIFTLSLQYVFFELLLFLIYKLSVLKQEKMYYVIKKISGNIIQSQSTFNRADLAYELKKWHIRCDSMKLYKLVYEAYRFYDDNENIKKAFYNNDWTQSLIKTFQLLHLIDYATQTILLIHYVI